MSPSCMRYDPRLASLVCPLTLSSSGVDLLHCWAPLCYLPPLTLWLFLFGNIGCLAGIYKDNWQLQLYVRSLPCTGLAE